MPEKLSAVEFLEYYSNRVMRIAIPVVLCLIFDAVLTRFLENTHGSVDLDRSFVETMGRNTGSVSTSYSIWIAVGIIGGILIVTCILVALYYYGCVKCIYVWMIAAVFLLLTVYTAFCFYKVPSLLNVPADWITIVLVLLNFVVIGNLSIFWRAPPIITQLFMVYISILIALIFLRLADWTIWILLVLLIVYDMCVVLCPHGLLKVLIAKSEERGDEIPALVYSSAAWLTNNDSENSENSEISENECENQSENEFNYEEESRSSKSSSSSDEEEPQDNVQEEDLVRGEMEDMPQNPSEPAEPAEQPSEEQANPETETGEQKPKKPLTRKKKPKKKKVEQEDEDDDEDRGVRLGLGDFAFYGVLVTRAARLGWDLVILCVFAVILGLSLTLIILAWLERPLPALPISLFLGIIFFITGAMTFRPFDIGIRQSLVAF